MKKSLSRPRILSSFRFGSELHFISSRDKFGDNLSVVATEDYRLCSNKNWYMESCQSVHGFIYLCYRSIEMSLGGTVEWVHVICNPSTNQLITLPKLGLGVENSYFVYDPIQKQFKILCWTSNKYQVLTLGTEELLWRTIECSYHPTSMSSGICINGVLYYIAIIINKNRNTGIMKIIVCFDIRSEKFSFIGINTARLSTTLINYKGKLGVLVYSHNRNNDLAAELWVLDDTKKDELSKQYSFVLPSLVLKDLKSVKATDTGELVWPSSNRFTHRLYVFYYNMERQRYRSVEIKGIEDKVWTGQDWYKRFSTFTNHVENLMLIQPYKKTGLVQDIVIKRVSTKKSDLPTQFSQDGLSSSNNVNREDINRMVLEVTPTSKLPQPRNWFTGTAYASSSSSYYTFHAEILQELRNKDARIKALEKTSEKILAQNAEMKRQNEENARQNAENMKFIEMMRRRFGDF